MRCKTIGSSTAGLAFPPLGRELWAKVEMASSTREHFIFIFVFVANTETCLRSMGASVPAPRFQFTTTKIFGQKHSHAVPRHRRSGRKPYGVRVLLLLWHRLIKTSASCCGTCQADTKKCSLVPQHTTTPSFPSKARRRKKDPF